ncbi:MAG: helix-turn-helix domain-containing protein [Bacteroidales bacterium]|nr:helix-turn-helix domain-containing protein [Bacteroidales bacterium]
MARNNSRLRNKNYDRVIHLYYHEGYSEERVATELQIGHTTVNRWVNEYAIERNIDKQSLRVLMGGKSTLEATARSEAQDTLLRQLQRKLAKARTKVAMLEEMIRAVEKSGRI